MKKLNNIKAVFIDLDGTLTNSNHEITKNTKTSVKRIKDKGIYVVLCSGRSNNDVCNYSKSVNASEYAISSNGAQIYNYNIDENLYQNEIEFIDLIEIWKYCEENELEIIVNTKKFQYGNNVFFSNIYKNRIIKNNLKELKNEDIYQITINSDNYYKTKKCEEFIKLFKDLRITNYSRDYINNNINSNEPYYLFINKKDTDKGIAIKKFLKIMGINKEDTICFGDRINDIEMFKNCGITVAMENADSKLKEIADYITLSNNEEGVTFFLNKYM